MKKRIYALTLTITMLTALIVPVHAAGSLPQKGKTIHGFTVSEVTEDETEDSSLVLFTHKKTGASVLYIANDDTNRAFDITFRTPAADTGISHVFEHATLSASEKYPLDIFFPISSRTATTFINALTYMGMTSYPLSSVSDEQLQKLADYYLDSVFHPLIRENKEYFDTEAWRYELTSPDGELTLNGTVYSEMRGALTADARAYYNTLKTVFPGSHKAMISGGDPDVIPTLTYDEVKQYHKDYYRPSNSLSIIYGKVDYEKYLKLLDSYFSEFDSTKADTEDKGYTPITGHVEKEFALPGGSATTIWYAIPVKTENYDEIFGLDVCSALLNADSSLISQKMQEVFPSAGFQAAFDTDSAEPCMLFVVSGVDKSDKDLFKKTVDDALAETVREGFDGDMIDAIAASIERSTLMSSQDAENIGIECIESVTEIWEYSGDPLIYFDMLDYDIDVKENAKDNNYENLLEKYIVNHDRSAITVNVPDGNLAAKKEAELKERLAAVKASLSDEEINEIIKRTTEEKAVDTELENRLINEINVSTTDALRAELDSYKTKEYPYTDENIDGVRHLTANADIGDIGEGRIYLDISALTDEQLLYLRLMSNMMGQLPTENYSQGELYTLLGRYVSGGDKFLPADDKLYYTFNFTALNDDIPQTYKLIYEILFNVDFSDTDTIGALISQILTGMERSVTQNPHRFIINRELAQESGKQAIYNYIEGLDYIDFLRKVSDELDENPEAVVNNLNAVQDALRNKHNAASIFAGNDEGIKLYKEASEAFFEDMPDTERAAARRNIPVPEGSEGIIIDGEINFNYIGASLDTAGVDRDGKFFVTSNIVDDKLLIPQLRYVKGAYGTAYNTNEYGTYICSYRDPQLAETFDYYAQLPDLVSGLDISQDELDGYIISSFVGSAKLRGELEDTWHFLSTKVYTSEKELYYTLSEKLDTTPADVKHFASVYQNLAEKGVKASIGKESDIIANADMFDKILIPFGSGNIEIYVEGDRIETDTAPVIKNDRTLVPIRVISEALGAEVNWNDETKTVTILGDKDIVMTIGETEYGVNETAMEMDTAPEIINERTMVPLRAVAEALDKTVDWKVGCIVIK